MVLILLWLSWRSIVNFVAKLYVVVRGESIEFIQKKNRRLFVDSYFECFLNYTINRFLDIQQTDPCLLDSFR